MPLSAGRQAGSKCGGSRSWGESLGHQSPVAGGEGGGRDPRLSSFVTSGASEGEGGEAQSS